MIEFAQLKGAFGKPWLLNLDQIRAVIDDKIEERIEVVWANGDSTTFAKPGNESFLLFIERRLRNINGPRAEEGDV